jgi:anthranilate synthase component 1
VFGYDMVRLLEPLGAPNPDPLNLPDAVLTRPALVAIFDSVSHEIVLVSAAYPDSGLDARSAFDAAVTRLDRFEADLRSPLPALPAPVETDIAPFRSPVADADFAAMVARAKDYIAAGDIFQVVLSHRFAAPWAGDPFAFYRSLRRRNRRPTCSISTSATSSWPGPAPRSSSASRTAASPSARSPAPAPAARRPRPTAPLRPNCWPIPRSAPST